MRSVLAKEVLKNQNTQTFLRTPRSNSTSPSSYASMKPSIHWKHASFKKGPKLDDPPQDVDKFHPSVSSSTTTILNHTCPSHTTSSGFSEPFHLNHKTTQLLKAQNDLPQLILPESHLKAHPALKLNFLLNQKDSWATPTFHQQLFSLNTMTINCPYYKRRLMHHMII